MDIFFNLAFEVQGAAASNTEICLNNICMNLFTCTEEPRVGIFLKQRISSQYRLRTLPVYSVLIMINLVWKKFSIYSAQGTKAQLYLNI